MEFKVIRQKITTRGGGVEIDLSPLGFDGHKMSAYQNYLGGGMLGGVAVNDTIRSQVSNVRLQLELSNRFNELDEIGERLREFYSDLAGIELEDYEGRSISAYQ